MGRSAEVNRVETDRLGSVAPAARSGSPATIAGQGDNLDFLSETDIGTGPAAVTAFSLGTVISCLAGMDVLSTLLT